MGTIVVGYVPRPEGAAALTAGIEEARLRGSRIVLVSSYRGGSDYDAGAAREAENELQQVRTQLAESGVDHEVRHLIRGFEPAEDVLAIAETEHADLIVIGLRHRTPVGKLLMGSNAQRVLLDATCPVLAVKA